MQRKDLSVSVANLFHPQNELVKTQAAMAKKRWPFSTSEKELVSEVPPVLRERGRRRRKGGTGRGEEEEEIIGRITWKKD